MNHGQSPFGDKIIIVIRKGGKLGWVAERMDAAVVVGHGDNPEELYDMLVSEVDLNRVEVVKDYESH